MIAFEGMLVPHAEDAGIRVPPDPEKYEPEHYPHWHVYCKSQIGAPIPYMSAPRDNAIVIAKIRDCDIRKVTFRDLEELGCVWGNSQNYA